MWVFGYGSLLWNPGFPVAENKLGRLMNYQRSFCMWSIHHRGTVEEPGLVLALDYQPKEYCDGVAFRVQPGAEEDTLAYLRGRELVSSAYLERILTVNLGDEDVQAVTYIIDPDHAQYCNLSLETQADVIWKAVGGRGPNTEYLFNTVAHLNDLGIFDQDLQWLDTKVRTLVSDQA